MIGKGETVAAPRQQSGYRTSLARLREVQKPRRGASLYSTRVNRPLGSRLAAAADALGCTPNQVTLLSGLSSFVAVGLLIARPASAVLGLVVSAFLAFGFALDSADGQLSRLRQVSSPAGEWLDHMVDCATKLALHLAVLLAWYAAGVRGAQLLLPLAFQVVAVLLFFGGTLAAKLFEHSAKPRPAYSGARRLTWLLLLPADHGLLCLSFLLWGWPSGFRAFYLALFAGHAVVLAAFSVNWFRELS